MIYIPPPPPSPQFMSTLHLLTQVERTLSLTFPPAEDGCFCVGSQSCVQSPSPSLPSACSHSPSHQERQTKCPQMHLRCKGSWGNFRVWKNWTADSTEKQTKKLLSLNVRRLNLLGMCSTSHYSDSLFNWYDQLYIVDIFFGLKFAMYYRYYWVWAVFIIIV